MSVDDGGGPTAKSQKTYECPSSGRDLVEDVDAIWTRVTGSFAPASSWWVGMEKRSQKPGSWMAIFFLLVPSLCAAVDE